MKFNNMQEEMFAKMEAYFLGETSCKKYDDADKEKIKAKKNGDYYLEGLKTRDLSYRCPFPKNMVKPEPLSIEYMQKNNKYDYDLEFKGLLNDCEYHCPKYVIVYLKENGKIFIDSVFWEVGWFWDDWDEWPEDEEENLTMLTKIKQDFKSTYKINTMFVENPDEEIIEGDYAIRKREEKLLAALAYELIDGEYVLKYKEINNEK